MDAPLTEPKTARTLRICGGVLLILGGIGGVGWFRVQGDTLLKLLAAVGPIIGTGGAVVILWSARGDLRTARRWLAIVAGGLVVPTLFCVWLLTTLASSPGWDADLVWQEPWLHIALLSPVLSFAVAAGTRLLVGIQQRVGLIADPAEGGSASDGP